MNVGKTACACRYANMTSGVLAVIVARAGSKGLPGKNLAVLAGRPLAEHTVFHLREARSIDAACVTTDCPGVTEIARQHGLFVVARPPELATDTAPVDAALRHAVEAYEKVHPGFRAGVVVLLYGNIPVRAPGVIDRAVQQLRETGADSVRTVAPVGKHHPDWLHRLDGDRMAPFRPNRVHRRQDLEPLYYHDGAVVAVTRAALETPPSGPDDHHAFFGRDRRALVQPAEAAVDVDTAMDLAIAEAVVSHESSRQAGPQHRRPGLVCPREPFIIAEAGVNHNGDVGRALKLIEAARAAGVDAVKFQAFSADRLVSRDAAACAYQQEKAQTTTQHEMLRRLQLDRAAFERLADAAIAAGLIFLATPFGIEELGMVISLGVPAIKLASTDLTNVPLVEAAARSGVPLIMSTGTAETHEIDAAMSLLQREGASERVTLLHCVSRYPTPQSEANLAAIRTLQRRYGAPVGFSDHTPDVDTGALAVAAGAVMLEKHLTLDRTEPGPDHFFSLTPEDFRTYVRAARAARTALGHGEIRCDPAQADVRGLARGRIVATADIPCGELLTQNVLTVRRTGRGIEAGDWSRVLGHVAQCPIPAGEPLTWAMVGRSGR